MSASRVPSPMSRRSWRAPRAGSRWRSSASGASRPSQPNRSSIRAASACAAEPSGAVESGGLCRPRRTCRPGIEQLARQGMADDRLGKARAFDQAVEIDAGLDAELAAEEDDLLAADIASGRLVSGEGTAAETAEAAVEMIDALDHPAIDLGDPTAAPSAAREAEP